jgi:hypothetical protein
MNVVLLRVGIDTGSGGILGPLFSDSTFEFVPIPDGLGYDRRTYGNTMGRHGRLLIEYFPTGMRDRMSQQPMHVDPEFATYTYGDPASLKGRLRELKHGDMLVFYAGLKGYDCVRPPALYIVGYFEVEVAGRATSFSDSTLQSIFSANFHVMHPEVFATQRDHLVLVKGTPASRLFERAVPISEVGWNKSRRPIHVLSQTMREVCGDFGGHVAIQRSSPRWIPAQYAARVADLVKSL